MAGNGPVTDNRAEPMRDTELQTLDIKLLGTLEVWKHGAPVALGGGRQRALLALLALRPNQVVSSEWLIEELWEGRPPPTAAKALQNLVAQLRRALGQDQQVLITGPQGYELRLGPDAVDARRFERAMAEGLAIVESDPATAGRLLRDALELWRGDPLADFADSGFAQSEIARLQELRLGALEARIDADLACGRDAELVPEAEALVAAHPLRERLRGQLMLALYRSGRQADALAEYREARALFQDELGLEPGRELKQLEQAILAQDQSLGPARKLPPRALRSTGRRVWIALAAAIAGVAAIGVAALALTGDGAPTVVPDSLVKIDSRTNEIVDVVPVGRQPGPVVVAGRYVVVSSAKDSTLSRVDRRSADVVTQGGFATPRGLAFESGARLWVVNERDDEVVQIDVERIVTVDRLGVRGAGLGYVAVGGGSLWLTESAAGALSRWRLPTLELQERYRFESGALPLEVGFGRGSAWVALVHSGELLRIDAASGRSERIRVGDGPGGPPTMGFGSIWTTSTEGTVWRVDAATGKVRAIVRVGGLPFGVAVGAGAVWVANHDDGTVARIDPATDRVVATIRTGFFPEWLAADDRYVWVGLSRSRWSLAD